MKITLGVTFLMLGIVIALWQRRAGTCSRHSRWAGGLAWVLCVFCFLAGAATLVAE